MIASREYVKDLLIKVFSKKLGGVGTMLTNVTENKACTKDTQGYLNTLTLPEGVWIIRGYFRWEGSVLRYVYYVNTVSYSAYDSKGWVFGNATDIVIVPKGTTKEVKASIWSSDKAITVKYASLYAVKVANV